MSYKESLISVKGYTRPIKTRLNYKLEHIVYYDNELTALLSSSMNYKYNNSIYYDQQQTQEQALESYSSHFCWLLSSVVALLLPIFITNIGRAVTVSSVGHLGAQELAGMSLAQMIELCTFLSLSLGMSYTLDTLCGQSWTSAIDKKIIGIQLQRGLFIYSVLVLPIVIIWGLSLVMLQNMKFVGPDTVVLYAGTYLLFNIPGSLSFAVAYMIAAYLRAQGIMRVVVYGTALAFPVKVAFNYLLVGGTSFNLGVAGASISDSMGSIILCAYTIGYSYWIVGSKGGGWGGWTRQCLHGCMPTLKLLVPSTFLQLIQIATPQLGCLVASYFGTAALGAYFILLQTNAIFLSLAFSLRHAMMTRIGNLMGKGSLIETKRSIVVASSFAFTSGMICATVLVSCRSIYPAIYTNDDEVAHIVFKTLPTIALSQIIGSLSYCQVGIAYGLGRQRQTAIITFFAYLLVGIPVGYFCAFTLDWAITGLWTGMVMAEFAVAIALFFYLYKLDWDLEVCRIIEQVTKERQR